LRTAAARALPPAQKKEDITMNHLPAAVRDNFRIRFIPVLRQLAGSLGPWDSLEAGQITHVWYVAFPQFNSQIDEGLLWIVTKLVMCRRHLISEYLLTFTL
jgi:hypothetical protein